MISETKRTNKRICAKSTSITFMTVVLEILLMIQDEITFLPKMRVGLPIII